MLARDEIAARAVPARRVRYLGEAEGNSDEHEQGKEDVDGALYLARQRPAW